jgi:hypothetical protein
MAKSFPNTGVTTGLAADRTAMTGMYAGQQFFETDTNKVYIYNGSDWFVNDWLGTWPSFWVRRLSASTAVGTITFDSVLENTGSNYSTSTGLFTAPVSGIYYFSGQFICTTSGGAWVFVKNGSIIAGPLPYSTTTVWSVMAASVSTKLNAGETMGIRNNSGVSLYGDANLTGGVHNGFSGSLIKPL